MLLNVQRIVAEAVNEWQTSHPGIHVKGILISKELERHFKMDGTINELDFFNGELIVHVSENLPLFQVEILAI